MVSAILAVSDNGIIGNENDLPWPHIKEDMKWFMDKTHDNVVVMGRKTWDSLGILKPLKDRINVVISSRPLSEFPGAVGTINGGDLCSAIRLFETKYPNKEIMVMGGAEIYKQLFPACDVIYLTRVIGDFDGDTSMDMDSVLTDFNLDNEHVLDGVCIFQTWMRK